MNKIRCTDAAKNKRKINWVTVGSKFYKWTLLLVKQVRVKNADAKTALMFCAKHCMPAWFQGKVHFEVKYLLIKMR